MKRIVHLFSAVSMALTSSIPAEARTCEAFVAADAEVVRSIETASPLLAELSDLEVLEAEVAQALKSGILNSLDSEETSNLQKLEQLIGPVSDFQKAGVILAHRVGVGEAGPNGAPAESKNYTKEQLRRKIRYLMAVSFELKDRKVILREGIAGRVLGAIGGFLVGGPIGAVSGYYLGKKAEQGKLNGKAIVTGAVIGAVIDGPFAEDSVVNGALYGAAAGQLVGGDKENGNKTSRAEPKPEHRPLNQMPSYTPPAPTAPKPSTVSGGDWERRFAARPQSPPPRTPRHVSDRQSMNRILAISFGALAALGIILAVTTSRKAEKAPTWQETPRQMEPYRPRWGGGVIL